jgi:hypothetical protein
MISISSKEAGWRGDATKCDPWGDCVLICPVRPVQEKAGDGLDHAGPPYWSGIAQRSLSAHPEE